MGLSWIAVDSGIVVTAMAMAIVRGVEVITVPSL